jgi:hypothetical protein
LRRSLRVFVEHYERERNHQGLGNRLIIPTPMNGQGLVKRRERLGRTINFYYRPTTDRLHGAQFVSAAFWQ